MEAQPTDIPRASNATFVCFSALGLTFATWAGEIPRVKTHEHLSAASLGLVLLAVAGGSLGALPLSGLVVSRIRSDKAVAAAAAAQGLALVLIGAGYVCGLGLLIPSLIMFGLAMGLWDVAVNVQGAAIERVSGRAVLPRFHAGFSMGTVTGALLSAAAIALKVPAPVHLAVLGFTVIAAVPLSTRRFIADTVAASVNEPVKVAPDRSRLGAWRERRTLLIGLAVLGFAFAEGTGNDWLSVAFISGYHVPAAVGSLGFALFVAAMTVIRWYGPTLLERYGRVVVLRWLGAAGALGVVLFALGPSPGTAVVGALLWGMGASLGFPVGISAAADDPDHAPQRVSVVVSMGYTAFLAGPPLIGFIADHVTVHRAVLIVAGLLLTAMPLLQTLRPPTHNHTGVRAALPPK